MTEVRPSYPTAKGYASSLTKPNRRCPQCDCEWGYLYYTEPSYADMWVCAECDHKFVGSQESYDRSMVGGGFYGSGLGLNDTEFEAWNLKQGLITCPKCGFCHSYHSSPTTARKKK